MQAWTYFFNFQLSLLHFIFQKYHFLSAVIFFNAYSHEAMQRKIYQF